MWEKHCIEIPISKLTRQQVNNIWFSRPICYKDDCDETTCRAYQKENIEKDNICYIKANISN